METFKFYYLKTCDTCKRIMNELGLPDSIQLREIKSEPITIDELNEMHEQSGSYEDLLNKRARKYREQGLNKKSLGEDQIRDLILDEYTFLKRPVLLVDDQIFIGNSKKEVAQMKQALENL